MGERTIHAIPSPNGDNPLEAARSMRDAPPAHYTFKIESFSVLSKILSMTGMEKYESGNFEVANYKWRLSLYPNGDKKRNGSGHISLYLVLAETHTLPLGMEVNVFFKLFVYDQIRDKYLTVQDVHNKVTRFHAMKTERGFSQLVPLSTFNDAANGYLVDDCCVLGAEVFVSNCTGKGESFSIVTEPQKAYFTWKIDNFSKLHEESIYSEKFNVGGHNWYLRVCPNGHSRQKGRSLSFFIYLKDFFVLRAGQKLYVEYMLRVKDQVHGNHHELTGKAWFCSLKQGRGFSDFLPLSDLKDKLKGFIVKDTLIVEAKITLLSAVKNFS